VPVTPRPLSEPAVPGKPSTANATSVLASIDQAIDDAREGDASAIVTNPISKAVLHRAGFELPGHTEYLEQRLASDMADDPGAGPQGAVMLLVGGGIRVALATIHQPLAAVPELLSVEGIVRTTRILARALTRDFGIEAPRIALCGLNPHAGESGDIGREEIEIINPAAEVLRQGHSLDVSDAIAADSLFAPHERKRFDGIVAMYHDQGLIPVKTLDFDGGVNVTLGLPVVRTSPDHGTGFGIAGTGEARPDSLIAAIRLAADIAARRTAARQAAGDAAPVTGA
jgi:4-hydroxythreonine-4-phosphate dehydrogenase